MKRFYLAVNPHGGLKKGLGILDAVRPILEDGGAELTVLETEYAGHARDYANEVDESNEDNNIALTTIDVTVNTFVQGPNEQFGLDEDEYWFYFNEYGDCLSLDVPEPTQFCLVSDGPFVSKLLVNNEEVKLYHIFSLFSLTANVGNLEIQIGDGFWVSYE